MLIILLYHPLPRHFPLSSIFLHYIFHDVVTNQFFPTQKTTKHEHAFRHILKFQGIFNLPVILYEWMKINNSCCYYYMDNQIIHIWSFSFTIIYVTHITWPKDLIQRYVLFNVSYEPHVNQIRKGCGRGDKLFW